MKSKILVGLYVEIKKAIQKEIDKADAKFAKLKVKHKKKEAKFDEQYDAILQKQIQNTVAYHEASDKLKAEVEQLKKLL